MLNFFLKNQSILFTSLHFTILRSILVKNIEDSIISYCIVNVLLCHGISLKKNPNSSSEKAMAPYSSTFAWKIPGMEEPGRLQSMGSLESDTTERLHFHFSLTCTGERNGNPLQCSCLENPRDGEPGGLPSMGSNGVGHD